MVYGEVEDQFRLVYLLVEVDLVLVLEGIFSTAHFVENYSQGPIIGRESGLVAIHHFRREKDGGSNEALEVVDLDVFVSSLGLLVFSLDIGELGEEVLVFIICNHHGRAEVHQLQPPILGKHYILGLQVSVNDAHGVEVLEGVDDLGRDMPNKLVFKLDFLLHQLREGSVAQKLQEEVEEVLVLESFD